MNINVSYNWLKEYLPGLKASPEQVAEKLSLHAFSVEKWRRMNEGIDPSIVVGKIVKIESHPNADRLRITRTTTNSIDERPRTIVCGGTNLSEGQLVAVALPGAKVRWHGEGEPIELKSTEIRGVKSEGMICAADEIGLGEMFPHKDREILNISWSKAKPGTPLAEALELDDTVFEVEVTTNRPDAMGMIGIAREVGAIFNTQLKVKSEKLKGVNNSPRPPLTLRGGALSVKVETPKLCPRYIAVVMDNIKVGQSPWWMQRRLIASGIRPINNLVDITNYVLLEWGRPAHVFDYDKLYSANDSRMETNSKQIIVRKGKKGEKMLALDGVTYEFDENILVIADGRVPVDIGGIMGGEETGVHTDTTRIVFEIANFDSGAIRRGEHQLGLGSDSSARFNKGLPSALADIGAARLVELTQSIAGGKVVQVIDKKNEHAKLDRVRVSTADIVKKIGVVIPEAQMKKYLTALGFKVSGGKQKWQITFPFWRFVEAGGTADIAEEVARMYGYYKIPGILPEGSLSDELPNLQLSQEHALKEVLRGAGYTEIYTYSFASRDDVARAGFVPETDALAIANPLSSEASYMRPWLGMSILKAIAQNEKQRDTLKLFEVSAEYHPRHGNLPDERQKLIVVSAGKETTNGEHFYAVKGVAEHLAEIFALPSFGYEKVGSTNAPWVRHYHPSRVLLSKSGRDILGVIGEIHPSLLRAYGLAHRVAFLEWEMSTLYPLIGQARGYTPPLPYPSVKRDIACVVSAEIEYTKLHTAIAGADPLIHEVELFDQYEGKGVPEGHRSLAFHISYASPERTLTSEQADRVHAKLIKMLEKKFDAKIRN